VKLGPFQFGHAVGPAKELKVQKGDIINMIVQAGAASGSTSYNLALAAA
jgi:hypothetical protein